MAKHRPGQHGTYRQTRERFPLMMALAVSVAVDRAQGFVKAGNGSYDPETQVRLDDNRSLVLRSLRVIAGGEVPTDDSGNALPVATPTDADVKAAEEILVHFNEILVFDKLTDDLVKVGRDGRTNDFNAVLAAIFGNEEVDTNKELAMIVSLPNSRRTSDKRQEMANFNSTYANAGYIGAMKERMTVTGKVKDVKHIPRHQLDLVTVLTTEGQIAKFFMNTKLRTVAGDITGTDLTFVGTVKKQDVNDFTNCQETMFNRVKFA